MNFTDTFKEKGEWWLPENDTIKCFGELSYDPKSGILLSVYGSLINSKSILYSQNNFPIKIIVGKTQSGKCITLVDALGHETGSETLLESTFDISYAIINSSYFSTPDTDQFDLVSINLNCSEAFFYKLYKTIEVEEFDAEGDFRKFKYEKTGSKHIHKNEISESSLFFSYFVNRSRDSKEEFTFGQRVFLNTYFTLPLNLESSISFAKNIKAIFTFFSTYKIFFNHLNLREKETKEIFAIIFNEERLSKERLGRIDLLTYYNDIEGEFEEMFKWFRTNQDFVSNGLSLYLQLLNSKIKPFPQRFLSVVFALETLHSSLLDKKPFTKEEYKKFKEEKKKIILDEKFRKRFDDCMSHFNSISFSGRISDLISRNLDLLKEYIYDIDDFVIKIKEQRNYFAHNHSINADSLIPEHHYDYFVDTCKLIFEVSFLSIIGISQKNLKIMLKRNFYHNYFKSKMPNRSTEP